MKLVKIYEGKVTEEKEITSIDGLSNSDVVKGFKHEGFKNQKTLKVRGCSSVKYINEFLSSNEVKKAKKEDHSKKMSFEEYVSDFFDLHIALMSSSDKAAYYKTYKGE